jgi:cytochrome oxidase assembly protein ShyY1
MVLENNAFKEKILPYLITWLVFNILLLALVMYISIRITFK